MSSPQAPSATLVPASHENIPFQENPLSSEWIHAITILMGWLLTSEIGQNIQKWILSHGILSYTNFALRWDQTQFKYNIHLQMYEEIDGSLAYLKNNTVNQLVGIRKHMSMLISEHIPDAQKPSLLYFITGNQLFKLTAHDMRSALVKEVLENHRSQTTPGTPMSNFTSPSSSASLRSPIHLELAPFKKGIKPDDPAQDEDKPHLSDSTSTITI